MDYAPHFNKTLSPNIPYKDVNKVCLYYASFDKASTETIRLAAKPAVVKMGTAVALSELKTLDREGYTWTPLPDGGGILKVRHDNWHEIAIYSE